MNSEDKLLIYRIITSLNLSIQEKFNQITLIFPDYLNVIDEKKVIYEKIEGIFHDGLGTYFEHLLFDEINIFYGLKLQESDKNSSISKMKQGIALYEAFFPKNQYNISFSGEVENVEKGSKTALEIVKESIGEEKIRKLTHSALDFSNGNARDIYITLQSGEELNFSLKTDKSGKVAISDGQTSKIFEKVYSKYFNLSVADYNSLKNEIFKTVDEKIIFEDYQNVALLTQRVLIHQFALEDVEINNFENAIITNLETLEYCISQLKENKNGSDNASVILVNRKTGEIGFESILDSIIEIDTDDFGFNPHNPRKPNKYGSTLGLKYKGDTFITFQVKHERGDRPSRKFRDITIRLEEIKKNKKSSGK